jgi:hypothetical protein
VKEFNPGDRVMLDPKGAECWIDPKLRLRARDRCAGIVRTVIGTACAPKDRSYRVDFDTTGRKRPLSEIIPISELIAYPTKEPNHE